MLTKYSIMKGVYSTAWMLIQIAEKEIDILIIVTFIRIYGECRTCGPNRYKSEVSLYWFMDVRFSSASYFMHKINWVDSRFLHCWSYGKTNKFHLMNSETSLLIPWYLYDSNFCALKEKKDIMAEKRKVEIIWVNESRSHLELFYMEKGSTSC